MTAKRLRISPDLSLSLETVTNTIAILGRRRVGKSYTAAVIAEEMVKAGLPWVVLDPTGVWWGLGSSADGKQEGLPVIVVGGPHAHIPLEPNAGKIIANMVVDNPGWYVIDFSRFDEDSEIYTFAAAFGKQIYWRHQRKAEVLHLFLDEADIFIPQVPINKLHLQVFRTFDNIQRRGGVYGLGLTLISQRQALVNKNNITQCETLIALRASDPLDQDPIFDKVSRNSTKENLALIKSSLAILKKGQAWYFSPDNDLFKLVQIRERETFNSSATPTPGAKAIEPKVFSKVDLDKLGEQIKATVEKSKKEDPNFLNNEIRRLEQEKAEWIRKERNMVPASESIPTPAPKIVTIELPMFEEVHISALESAVADLKEITEKTMKDAGAFLSTQAALIVESIEKAKAIQNKAAIAYDVNSFKPVSKVSGLDKAVQTGKPFRERVVPEIDPGVESTEAPSRLPTGHSNILKYCAQHFEGLRRDQLTVFTGYKKDTRNTYIRELINWGYVRDEGSLIQITRQGTLALGENWIELPEGEQLRRNWISSLPKGEAEILEILISNYPNPVSRNQLTELTGYKKDTRNTYLRTLINKLFLVNDLPSSNVKASDYLFG